MNRSKVLCIVETELTLLYGFGVATIAGATLFVCQIFLGSRLSVNANNEFAMQTSIRVTRRMIGTFVVITNRGDLSREYGSVLIWRRDRA